MIYFPFIEYWWFYAIFLGFVFILLALDLGVFHKEAHAVTFRESATWSAIWVTISLIFNVGFYFFALNDLTNRGVEGATKEASRLALEFLSGYLIEKSLSVDNIFVFVLIFGFFKIPLKYQHRVLFFGIIGALVFRGIFISLGALLMQYHWVIYVFGGFLIFTGIKMAFANEGEKDLSDNIVLKFLSKALPTTRELHDQKFFVVVDGLRKATPLFVALIFIEISDVIFAVDSVPAIFALTNEPMIVFTSNVFAILGLRALFFMLAGVVDKFHLLKYGLAIVLVFVGLKMVYLNDAFGGKFPIGVSLGIIGGVIGLFIALSLIFPKKDHDSSSSN